LVLLLKQFLQNGEGAELWELRDMQTVVEDEELKDAVAVGPA
jgi:hypothetical protein